MRVFPTIWVHIWTVSQVDSHSANGTAGQSSKVKLYLVGITPAPVLAWFERPDDGVGGRVEMFCRVLVFGRITPPDVSAYHAQAQVNPPVAHLQAPLASTCMGFYIL